MADTTDGPIPYFLGLLAQYNTAIPIQSQWILEFESIPKSLIDKVSQYENYILADKESIWKHSSHTAILTEDGYQKVKGCIFAQSVKMPPDGVATERVGDYNGGYVKGLVTGTRMDFGTFDTAFLETNLSFADIVLRPWSIMASHRSLIARGNSKKEKGISSSPSGAGTNVNVYHLAKAGAGKPMIVRKHFIFYDCFPVSVDSEEYNYSGDKIIQRQVSFGYSYYSLGNAAQATGGGSLMEVESHPFQK